HRNPARLRADDRAGRTRLRNQSCPGGVRDQRARYGTEGGDAPVGWSAVSIEFKGESVVAPSCWNRIRKINFAAAFVTLANLVGQANASTPACERPAAAGRAVWSGAIGATRPDAGRGSPACYPP